MGKQTFSSKAKTQIVGLPGVRNISCIFPCWILMCLHAEKARRTLLSTVKHGGGSNSIGSHLVGLIRTNDYSASVMAKVYEAIILDYCSRTVFHSGFMN